MQFSTIKATTNVNVNAFMSLTGIGKESNPSEKNGHKY